MKNFIIENGDYGPRAVLTSAWDHGTDKILNKKGVIELELNDSKGWQRDDLSYLSLLPTLKAFTLIDLKIDSVENVHCLHNLLKLEIITYCKTKIDFSAFPVLEDCGLEWRPKASSIFKCKTLKRLFLNKYQGKDTNKFSELINLETVSLLNGPINSLVGLGNLINIKSLRLGNLSSLNSLKGISNLKNIEVLEIQKCKKISIIDEVRDLTNLKRIILSDIGEIESLNPLKRLLNLEEVLFYGDTKILDGDLSFLLGLKHLKNVAFQNRNHYSHKLKDFSG